MGSWDLCISVSCKTHCGIGGESVVMDLVLLRRASLWLLALEFLFSTLRLRSSSILVSDSDPSVLGLDLVLAPPRK